MARIEVWTPTPEQEEAFREYTQSVFTTAEPDEEFPDIADPDETETEDPEWVEKAMVAVPLEELLAETKALDTDPDPSPKPGARRLRHYWTRGPGAAKIVWGTPGDFNRCVAQLGKYVTDPKGLCNVYHRSATGHAPGKHKSEDLDLLVKRAEDIEKKSQQ